MEFRCRLGTPSGEIVEGVYTAEDEAGLRRELNGKGLLVLSLQRRGIFSWSAGSRRGGRLGQREFIVFNQELATLLKAGLPLVESLDILRQRVENPVLKQMLDDVHERVRRGRRYLKRSRPNRQRCLVCTRHPCWQGRRVGVSKKCCGATYDIRRSSPRFVGRRCQP